MSLFKNVISRSIIRSLRILPTTFKRRSFFLLLGIVVNSFFDLLGLAAILPLIAVILRKGFIQENKLLSTIFETLGFSDHRWFIVFLCCIIMFFIVVKNLFGLWIQKKQIQFSWDAYENISASVFQSIYARGFFFFNEQNSNVILNRIIGVPQGFSQMLLIQLFLFLNELVVLTVVLISLLIFDFKIVLILGGIIFPVFYFFYNTNKKNVVAYSHKLNELSPQVAKPVVEATFGYVDVIIAGVFQTFQGIFNKKILESKLLRTHLSIIQQIPNRLIEVCVILAVVLMLLYGVFFLDDTSEIVGLLSVFGLAAYRSIPSINRLMLSLVQIKGQEFNLSILEEFLPFFANKDFDKDLTFNKRLALSNVSFKYKDSENYIVKNFNLEIAKGESVGIIGKSGSGKTTIMNLMLGFLSQESGAILIDDTQLEKQYLTSWQSKIGYVRQDVFLIDGSVIENIAFGVPTELVDYDKLEKVIDKAQLRQVVNELSNGISTNIGERGAKISGGQRQRIGIARALYRDVEVLFFDEATSALDSTTETEITESIGSLHNDELTIVIIAHRQSTLKYCDRIIDLSREDH